MQQPCSRCGYISDRPARFCRQCGSPLFNETESSSASTRNYAPQQAHPQYGNQPGAYLPYAPDRQLDEQTPDTSPFYRPPGVPQYQVPQYQMPAQEQRPVNWSKWVLIGVAMFFLFSALVGVVVYRLIQSPLDRTIGETRGGGTIPVPPIPDIPPIPEIPPIPGIPPAPGAPDVVGQLERFKYPDAKVTKSHKDSWTETMTMIAEEDLETVKEFYDEKFKEIFKNSPTSISSEDGQKVTYVSLSKPMLTIVLQLNDGDHDKTRISIIRTNLPIPEGIFPKDIRRN